MLKHVNIRLFKYAKLRYFLERHIRPSDYDYFIAINSDNGASQAAAKKMGFQANGTTHIMTKEMFMQKYNSMSFSESNIGHVTDSSNAELKNNAQKRVQSDIEQDKSKDDSVTEISQS